MANYTFTVFTPTYNRAHTLPRVYESLKKQTFHDFEWLIVDDGSVDGTAELVTSWQKDTPFPIRYLWQKNRHKKVAFNRGVREARGELFLPLDSDDECVPYALERFIYHWNQIPADLKEKFSGVTALCMDQNGRVIGDYFPGEEHIDSDSQEIRYKYGVRGEKWGFHRTEILREYPFPEDIKGHVPEGLVWSAIAQKYKTRFVNEALRVYYQEGIDRLMKSKDIAGNSHGHFIWMDSILENEINWFWYRPGWFLKIAGNWVRFGWYAKLIKQNFVHKKLALKLLIIITIPLGLMLLVLDKLKQRRKG